MHVSLKISLPTRIIMHVLVTFLPILKEFLSRRKIVDQNVAVRLTVPVALEFGAGTRYAVAVP